jgi:phage-related protein
MKIYTEVNYKWLDGQLVKTDSKSFEYNGEVTLCMPGGFGGGGGGGGGVDPLKKVTETVTAVVEPVAETVKDVAEPVAETVKDVVEPVADVGDKVTEAVTDVADVVKPPPIKPPPAVLPPIKPPTGLGKITEAVAEGVSTGTAAIGAGASSAGQAATTNVANLGSGSGGTLGQVAGGVSNVGEQISTGVTSGITQGVDAIESGITNTVETTGKGLRQLRSNALNLHEDIKGGLKYYKDKIAKQLGSDKIIGGLTDTASGMIGGSGGPGSKSAPGVSETIGSKGSSNITMKEAVAAKGQKAKAGARGKRSLRKIA